MRTSRYAMAVAAGVLALAGAAAGCGSSDDASTGSTAAATQGAGGSGIATAEKELAPVLEEPTSIGITEPLKESPAGKVVDYMECGVSECKLIGDRIEEGAEPLGIKVNRVPAGNTPESLGRAFDQSVENKPDGVVVSGVSKALYAKQLAELKKLGIPVVSMGTADLPSEDGLAQVLLGGNSYRNAGKWAADWAIVDSDGSAKVLLVTAPVFDFNVPLAESFEATMQRNCPDCSVDVMGVNPEDIGKGVPGQIVSHLQQKPDTDYVITAFGSLMLGVPQAVRAAGLQDKVTLFTLAPGEADFQFIKDGLEDAGMGSSRAYLGWMTADQIARAMTGQDPAKVVKDEELPWWRLFTADTIDWDVEAETGWPFIPDFREEFKKLWGVS